MRTIDNLESFEKVLKEKQAVMAYFSHDNCNVCKVLKPKLSEALSESFPLVEQVYVNIEVCPEVAESYRVTTVPTVVIFLDGQETIRKSRSFGVGEVLEGIERPYSILFG